MAYNIVFPEAGLCYHFVATVPVSSTKMVVSRSVTLAFIHCEGYKNRKKERSASKCSNVVFNITPKNKTLQGGCYRHITDEFILRTSI